MCSQTNSPPRILLVEDDDGHAELVLRGLERAGISNPLLRARNGKEALDAVQDHLIFHDSEVDDLLILLDINMPKINGFEVLRVLRDDVRTAAVPVIVITTTDDPDEIAQAYQLGCDSHLSKPFDPERFLKVAADLAVQIIAAEPTHNPNNQVFNHDTTAMMGPKRRD